MPVKVVGIYLPTSKLGNYMYAYTEVNNCWIKLGGNQLFLFDMSLFLSFFDEADFPFTPFRRYNDER